MYGRCFIVKSKYVLPKEYLSYSAISLWYKDEEAFRARYYRNEPVHDNAYSIFGREVHKKLETNKELKHIPRLPIAEKAIKVKIEDLPLLGYIDGFCDKTFAFLDYKSGIRKADGSPRWTQLEVQKLEQLPFYAMLIKAKYGKVDKNSQLIWLETQWKEEEYTVGSQTLTGESNVLELTGYYEVFDRKIPKWEIDRITEWTLDGAEEISEDYQNYLASF